MARIANLNEIISRGRVEDVIGRRVQLRPVRHGDLVGSCPFHASRSGRSFHVYPDESRWRCWGCQTGGDVITFIERFENVNFPEAVELVAAEVGVQVSWDDTAGQRDGLNRPAVSRDSMLACLAERQRRYVAALPGYKAAWDYIAGRGFTPDQIQRWGIGFAAPLPFSESEPVAEAAGVCKRSDSGRLYDPMHDRLTIALHDHSGRVLGWTGRALDGREPKYLNTGDTPVFRKGRVLFGYHAAVELLRANSSLRPHVMEGQLKAIACLESGIPAVAPGGTGFTPAQAVLVARLAKNGKAVVCPDPDAAGVKAAVAISQELRSAELTVSIGELVIPDTITEAVKDPDDLLRLGLPVTYEYIPIVDWLYLQAVGNVRVTTADQARAVASLVVPLVLAHPVAAVRAVELRRVAELSGLAVEDLQDGTAPREVAREGEASVSAAVDTTMTTGRLVLAVLLQNKAVTLPSGVFLPGVMGEWLRLVLWCRQVAAAGRIPIASAVSCLPDEYAAPLGYWLAVDLRRPATADYLSELVDELAAEQRASFRKDLCQAGCFQALSWDDELSTIKGVVP